MEKGMTIDRFSLDQTFEKTVTVTEEMIENFSRATGDSNPIHLDETYAKTTIFKTRVAHGMLQAGILSGILGMEFPGIGTIYLSQTLKFTKPVFIGDAVTFRLPTADSSTAAGHPLSASNSRVALSNGYSTWKRTATNATCECECDTHTSHTTRFCRWQSETNLA